MKPAACFWALTLPLLATLAGCGNAHPQPGDTVPKPSSAGLVVRGRVDIEGGEVPLTALVDGVIAGVAVHEGEHVSKGQALLTIDGTAARIDEDLAQARLSEAESRVKLDHARVDASRTRADRLVMAAKLDAGDAQSADDAREALLQAIGELDSAQSGVRVSRADLERARYALAQHVLHAPLDGRVLRLTAAPGLHVSAQGTSLLTVLPDAARIVRAELSEDAIDQVSVGQHAQVISDDGLQTVLGTAVVLRIAPVYGPATLQEDPQERINERTVECVLALGMPTALRVGRRVMVRFASSGRQAMPASP